MKLASLNPACAFLQTAFALMFALHGCSDETTPKTADVSQAQTQVADEQPKVESAQTTTPPDSVAKSLDFGKFGDVVGRLSEPDGDFFSDNYISNETSYLQVANPLLDRPAGGVYLGVGPEQNFTYIALSRPVVAFIIDIRRGNMLEHLWYKAIFDEAESRSHFLTLLLGRPYDANIAPDSDADLETVIQHAERLAPDEQVFATTFQRLSEQIQKNYGMVLNANDKKTLEVTARQFLTRQLDIRFELHEQSGRRYPSLRELLLQTDPKGIQRSFLATEEAFRFVQTMQRDDRIFPIVGDFAGDRAMPSIAELIRKHNLFVSTFYVSNVEQYLLEPPTWQKWNRNIASLPVNDSSLFLRAYLDQGRRHPNQMKDHRTATILQRMTDFSLHQQKTPYRSFWAVATDTVL